ncbi:MAG: dihydrolipoyl dehydrogenase [Paramuribaculum sp.]|nr:dihydrolipoyl dehydrogenase [Paramuribaculum sp.]
MPTHDLIIIGAGPGGYDTAALAASGGQSVLLIEKSHLGGTCLNCGCIPTKALRHTAMVLEECRSAIEAGVECGAPTLHFAKAMARKDAVVEQLREGIATLLAKVEVVKGEAVFVGPHEVEFDARRFSAPKIIIATGSRPAVPPIEGAGLAMTSTDLLSIDHLPQSLAIIGGGVIGMEFASIFNSFGVAVTVIEMASEILPGMDADVAKRLRMLLKRRGVSFAVGACVERIVPGFTVSYTAKGKPAAVEADCVLMAVGRRPVVPAGIEEIGVELERGFIKVDPDTMATSADGVYAVGDVNGLCLLAHAAAAQGRRALGIDQSLDIIPAVAFTIPECAMVGLTADAARANGINVLTGTAFYRANGKSVADGATEGMLRITVDADTRRIIGCHGFGADVSMLVQEVATAMSLGADAVQMVGAVRSHPTVSEIITDALANLR